MAYASKYYDPVKAHQYYMAHRQLQGRKSTSTLNDSGKQAAKYVKEKLKEEKNQLIATYKASMNKKIESIKAKYKSLTKEQRKAQRDKIYADIKALRQANKQQSSAILQAYEDNYVQELDKIKADTSFSKATKKRKRWGQSK